MKLSLCINTSDDSSEDCDSPDKPDYSYINNFTDILEHELETLYPASKDYELAEISITFMKPDEIRTLNREYRDVDEPTDVLSFPMDMEENMPVLLPGDIVICPEEVSCLHPELESQEAMCLMIAHSFLHLLGYDHDTDEKQLEMWKMQDEIKDKLLEALR